MLLLLLNVHAGSVELRAVDTVCAGMITLGRGGNVRKDCFCQYHNREWEPLSVQSCLCQSEVVLIIVYPVQQVSYYHDFSTSSQIMTMSKTLKELWGFRRFAVQICLLLVLASRCITASKCHLTEVTK